MDKTEFNRSKSNSAFSSFIKKERSSLRNSKDNANIPRAVTKKRGVYVENFSVNGMGAKRIEEVPRGNKRLIESVLIILTKSSKATQWPDEKNVRNNIIKLENNKQKLSNNIIKLENDKSKLQFMNKKPIGADSKPVVLKPNTAVNKITLARAKHVAGKSPLAKTRSPADKTPQAKQKIATEKTARKKSKITVNKTTVAKSKTAVSKTTRKTIPEIATADISKPKFVSRRVKRFQLRKASPDNTLISDKIVTKQTPMKVSNDIIVTEPDNKLENTNDAKIYNLIKDFLENTINACSDVPSDKSDLNLHIDEEVAVKLRIKNDNDGPSSEHSLSNCLDTVGSSSTIRECNMENKISIVCEKPQVKRKVSAECMTEAIKIQNEENIKSKKLGKNITKPVIIANKTYSLEQPKQKIQKKSAPLPKFVNRSDYLVQHIYNIQLDSHTLKTKKVELVQHLKNPSVFRKPQNFFETLSLILKNKTQNVNNSNMENLQHFQKLKKKNKIFK